MNLDRRSVLRGALTVPVVAALGPLGGTSAAAPSAPAATTTRGTERHRVWDVERLDRRVHPRRKVA
jgi:hypothetical protein